MTRTVFDLIGTLKAGTWEEAKGKLRALVALEGSVSTPESERPYRFELVGKIVEKFITDFEDKGLHE